MLFIGNATTMLRGTPIEYELKRVNRFRLEFPSELGIEVWQCQTAQRPKININAVEIPYLNTVNYVAGQYKWEPLTVTLIDPIGPSSSQQLMEWIRLHAESFTGRMGVAAGYKKNLVLKALSPAGVAVEKWTLYECMVTNADFGDNDHSNDGLQIVTFTIQPFFCEQNY